MNQLIWAAMREYIQAEVKLAIVELRGEAVPELREQVTRFETEVRRLIDASHVRLSSPLSDDERKALSLLVPYGRKP